ncbi:hypothetical protein HDV01_005509 [Terramyces sp. JEL0728]|nr:hypothetical protein HDV01_005509 [Terramyces sp. JEL0728]
MSLVFQSGWYAGRCSGSPDTMLIFNDSNPTPQYAINDYYSPIPYCGLDLVSIDIGCCISTITPVDPPDYQSSSNNYFTNNLKESIPRSAIGKSFCHIHASNNASLFGYQDMYLSSSGKCLENYFKCTNNNLEIYNASACTGSVEVYSVLSNANILSASIGNVTLSKLDVTDGEMTAQWTTFIPYVDLIPNFSEPDEIFSLIVTIAVLISAFYSFYYLILDYLARKRAMDFWHILCILESIVKLTLYTAYQYTIFTSENALNIFTLILNITNIGSLMSTITSCLILISIVNVNLVWVKIGCVVFLILLHFALYGLIYYAYTIAMIDPSIFMSEYSLANTLGNYWLGFAVVFNFIPPLWILGRIIRVQYYKSKRAEDNSAALPYKKVIFLILGQLITGIWVFLLNFSVQLFVTDDRQFLGCAFISNALMTLNLVLLIAFFKELSRMTMEIVEGPHKKQEGKQVKLLDVVAKNSIQSDTVVSKNTFIIGNRPGETSEK